MFIGGTAPLREITNWTGLNRAGNYSATTPALLFSRPSRLEVPFTDRHVAPVDRANMYRPNSGSGLRRRYGTIDVTNLDLPVQTLHLVGDKQKRYNMFWMIFMKSPVRKPLITLGAACRRPAAEPAEDPKHRRRLIGQRLPPSTDIPPAQRPPDLSQQTLRARRSYHAPRRY